MILPYTVRLYLIRRYPYDADSTPALLPRNIFVISSLLFAEVMGLALLLQTLMPQAFRFG